MEIDVIISADQIKASQVEDKLVVVLDVLRATSVICTALSNGAKEVIPVENIDDALSYKKRKNHLLLTGERDGFKIEGFDLGNSPLEFKREFVADKTIVITTTNGTRAIKNSIGAKELIIGCFLNLEAICNYILEQDNDICIVCSGTVGLFSLDDALCAGNIIHELVKRNPAINLTDIAFAHHNMYLQLKSNLQLSIQKGCKHYSYLLEHGFSADLDYCFQKNTIGLVPKLKNNSIITH
jgi:2-phosphosulfolactate phosphatase